MAKPNEPQSETHSATKAKVTALLERLDENEMNHILRDPIFSIYAREDEENEASKQKQTDPAKARSSAQRSE